MLKSPFKGIAIFGAPGSGKTTVAQDVLPLVPHAVQVEAFRTAIQPAAALVAEGELPATQERLVRGLVRAYGKPVNFEMTRQDARSFFEFLRDEYTQDVVAAVLTAVHKRRLAGKVPVFAGVRGFRNAVALKKAGYFVVYLKTPDAEQAARLSRRESFSRKDAEKEREIEERIFSTNKVEQVAHLSLNPAADTREGTARRIVAQFAPRECRVCVNSSANPAVVIGSNGLCDICDSYKKYFRPAALAAELRFLKTLRGTGRGAGKNAPKYDAMVGISGGKDSTATLYEVVQMGFKPLAFSMDTGYYPKHIFPRAAAVAKQLGVDYVKIDAATKMRPADRACFAKTAELYGEPDSEQLREKFRKWYGEGRRHYSVKCAHEIPFVRTCQLCRRLIVRAYYEAAVKRGVSTIIIGINEWAGLSQDSSKRAVYSGIRKLQPFKNKPPVYVVHLPFILQRSIKDTERVLRKLGWKIPRGERLIESNSNSCLFALAAESKARRMLGFHPDASRLSREVTVGFISKAQAKAALNKKHASRKSVRGVLEEAGVL